LTGNWQAGILAADGPCGLWPTRAARDGLQSRRRFLHGVGTGALALLAFLVAAGEAALQGTTAASVRRALQGGLNAYKW